MAMAEPTDACPLACECSCHVTDVCLVFWTSKTKACELLAPRDSVIAATHARAKLAMKLYPTGTSKIRGLYDRRELILHFARFSLIKQEALSQPFKSREYRVGTVMVAFLIQVFPRKFANGVWPLSDMEPITLSI